MQPSINIVDLPSRLPNAALTLASRQLRKESLGYYRDATSALWHIDNTFILNIARRSDITCLVSLRRDSVLVARLKTLGKVEIRSGSTIVFTCTRRILYGKPSEVESEYPSIPGKKWRREFDDTFQFVVKMIRD